MVRASKSARVRSAGAVRQTLVERLISTIEEEILDGRRRPGERLEEVALSRRFALSRTPVREALRRLAASRLVEVRPRIGAVVASPTAGEVVDLFELVAELEGVSARLACERLSAANLLDIERAHGACLEAAGGDDAEAYWLVNATFHGAIHKSAGNAVLVEEIRSLDKRLAPYRRFITFRPGRTQTALQEHDQILRALQKRDANLAQAAMCDHVRILGDDAIALVKGLRVG